MCISVLGVKCVYKCFRCISVCISVLYKCVYKCVYFIPWTLLDFPFCHRIPLFYSLTLFHVLIFHGAVR